MSLMEGIIKMEAPISKSLLFQYIWTLKNKAIDHQQ